MGTACYWPAAVAATPTPLEEIAKIARKNPIQWTWHAIGLLCPPLQREREVVMVMA